MRFGVQQALNFIKMAQKAREKIKVFRAFAYVTDKNKRPAMQGEGRYWERYAAEKE